MTTPKPWTLQVLQHLARTRAAMSATQVEAMFGAPVGRTGRVSSRLDIAVQSGYLRKQSDGIESVYVSTGILPAGCATAEPTWSGIGRGAPRVASVFDMASGVTR